MAQPRVLGCWSECWTFACLPTPPGRMNLSLRDVRGGLLLVPQFTLAADTSSGHRPGFSTAAAPELAQQLFEQLVAAARAAYP